MPRNLQHVTFHMKQKYHTPKKIQHCAQVIYKYPKILKSFPNLFSSHSVLHKCLAKRRHWLWAFSKGFPAPTTSTGQLSNNPQYFCSSTLLNSKTQKWQKLPISSFRDWDTRWKPRSLSSCKMHFLCLNIEQTWVIKNNLSFGLFHKEYLDRNFMGLSLVLPQHPTGKALWFFLPIFLFPVFCSLHNHKSLHRQRQPLHHASPAGTLEKSFPACLVQSKVYPPLYWHIKLNTRFFPRCWRFSQQHG